MESPTAAAFDGAIPTARPALPPQAFLLRKTFIPHLTVPSLAPSPAVLPVLLSAPLSDDPPAPPLQPTSARTTSTRLAHIRSDPITKQMLTDLGASPSDGQTFS